MPRARCHWSLLVRTREALRRALPEAHDLAARYRGEYFAGGVAPDALRLFAGWDKVPSHFYDDQRRETWDCVVETICAAHPVIADPARLAAPSRAWMLGYLAHLMTDIAYWRHILSRLPPFPSETALHHGAWLLADRLEFPPAERTLDVDAIRFDTAPPWVEERPVRHMLDRVTNRILVPDTLWLVELAYHRLRTHDHLRTDEALLAEYESAWQANVSAARAVLPDSVWEAFQEEAIAGSLTAIKSYLRQPPAT
ncbi:MAG: hypothetical protein HY332_20655 [Chloroflexi bacterium]|nr:hypothetical protein [Chloroflexota bacterium]